MANGPPSRLALFWEKNGWFGLIFIGAGLLLLAYSAMLTASAERELNRAIETEGIVSALVVIEPGQRLSSSDAYETTSWLVWVDFIVDGQQYSGSRGIPEKHFEQLAKGDIIHVRYLPEDPDTIWLFSYMDDSWSSQMRFLGVVSLAFGLFLAWGPWVVAGSELKKTDPSCPE